jgi:cell division protein FtsW
MSDALYDLKKFIIKWFNDIDIKTVSIVFVISLFGLILMLSVSPAIALRIHVSKWHFISKHFVFLSLGFALMLFISALNNKVITKCCYFGFYISLLLLIVILFLGEDIKGAKRWINIGFFSMQPSEFMKAFFIVVNAKLLTIEQGKRLTLMLSLSCLMVTILLCIIQPDFGTAILYCITWGGQSFVSSLPVYVFSILAAIFIILCLVGFISFSHFRYRVELFLSGSKGEEQYQIKKSLQSIYSGGYFGKGLGEGDVKYHLPDSHTDYIFSVIGEEFGFIFASFLILLYTILILRQILPFVNQDKNTFERSVLYGSMILFSSQIFINIAVSINLIPSKGMALPFISYGGSATITNFIIFGIILAITRKSYHFKTLYDF